MYSAPSALALHQVAPGWQRSGRPYSANEEKWCGGPVFGPSQCRPTQHPSSSETASLAAHQVPDQIQAGNSCVNDTIYGNVLLFLITTTGQQEISYRWVSTSCTSCNVRHVEWFCVGALSVKPLPLSRTTSRPQSVHSNHSDVSKRLSKTQFSDMAFA